MIHEKKITVAVVGLGYVGLPLAVEFGKKYKTIGYDHNKSKIASYLKNQDPTGELSCTDLRSATLLAFTSDPNFLSEADFIIVAVPTPVTKAHAPDLSPLIEASKVVGKHMRRGVIIIFESTVYPGATEEICIPILEQHSGMMWKQDFHIGYSPERVNPGDKERTIAKIVKIVSGDNEVTLKKVGDLYESIILAGVHRARSIKVAEAAKVIENIQRDLNIALMNELAIIFNKMDIETQEVLEAAGTKWNFLHFRPGLVGGHCIGVDPYYLTHKAEILGYHPQVILAGRRINDGMATFVSQQTIKHMINIGVSINKSKIIVMGLTFKENCSDLRNSKVADLVLELRQYGCEVYVHDPVASEEEALNEYGINLCKWDNLPEADAIIAAVTHREYIEMPINEIIKKLQTKSLFVDIKSAFNIRDIESSGIAVWRV